MSRRITAFKVATIQPQTTCNYAIWIPSITRSPIAIELTRLPFKKTLSQSVYIRGIDYQIPVKQVAQGQWSCTMSENILMGSLYQSLSKWNKDVSGNVGTTNEVVTFGLGKVYIFITDALTGKAPVVQTILDDCYLVGIEDLNLNASGATDVMKVQLTFQYNNIIDPLECVNNIMGVNAGLTDGSLISALAMEAGVSAITSVAWGKEHLENKIRDKIGIKDMLL